MTLLDVAHCAGHTGRVAEFALDTEECVDLVTEVKVGATQQSLAAEALTYFRLIRIDDEVVEAVGHDEAETRVVDELRDAVHLQRLHVLTKDIQRAIIECMSRGKVQLKPR